MLRGYQSYGTFKQVIKQLTDGRLCKKKLEANEEAILNYIRKYNRVAPIEIRETFNLTSDEVKEYLDKFHSQKAIDIIPAGVM